MKKNFKSYYDIETKKYYYDKDNGVNAPIMLAGKEYTINDIDKWEASIFKCVIGIVAVSLCGEFGINIPKKVIDIILKL